MTAEGGPARPVETISLPGAETEYVRALVGRLETVLGDGLVGVYPTGSVALGAYTPGRSDLDVMAVVVEPPPVPVLRDIAARLSHDVLPCPATGLEFVMYPRQVVAAAVAEAGYVLDLNTGRELQPKISTDPTDEPRFWYVIDRAITTQCGLAWAGEPVRGLFAVPPFAAQLDVVVESMRTHAAEISVHEDNAVLNACRALLFATDRRWYPKPAAAQWAREAVPQFDHLIESAVASYAAGRAARRPLPTREVSAFLSYVLRRLESQQHRLSRE